MKILVYSSVQLKQLLMVYFMATEKKILVKWIKIILAQRTTGSRRDLSETI